MGHVYPLLGRREDTDLKGFLCELAGISSNWAGVIVIDAIRGIGKSEKACLWLIRLWLKGFILDCS